MSFYNLIDIVLLLLLIFFTYKAYKNKIYLKIFEYFKLLIIITLSIKLSSFSGSLLEYFHILKTDTYSTLILISFAFNFVILYYLYSNIIKILYKFINSHRIKEFFAKLFTFLEVLIILSFSLYIVMQLYVSKVYLQNTFNKTYSYPKIKRFYNKFLGNEFIGILTSSSTGTSSKEVIFKSFKNAF